jgi:surface protein
MKKLTYLFLALIIVACSSDDNGSSDQSYCPIYLDNNGVTIKACDDANVGDTGVINGYTYTVVDEDMLREMIENDENVIRVVTTKVTDMLQLFYIDADTTTDFNQNISSWDVSNVTTMRGMFQNATDFNQDIRYWDVSNVTNMNTMFWGATAFNQPIGDWDVSNVIRMGGTFAYANAFNQPIGDWDVSNVLTMDSLFYETDNFNQDISNWDVSQVNTMWSVFHDAIVFNQDISNWDVSQVYRMSNMFRDAYAFNQDLSSWSVDNVTDCNSFSTNSPLTDENTPNFTNCIP